MPEDKAQVPLWTWLVGGTHVLSFACFKLSRNCRPLVVVVCVVSAFAFDSACTRAVHCQQACTSSSAALLPLFPHASSGRAWCCGRQGGASGVVKWATCRTPSRSPSRGSPTPLAPRPPSTPTMHTTIYTIGGGTYRHFLALRRAPVAIAHSSTGGFALRRAFHFAWFRGRVVYPSQSQ